MIKDGNDPIEARKRKKNASHLTFAECTKNYIDTHTPNWTKKHTQQWINTLNTYAMPIIGKRPVSAIDTEDILLILKPIWFKKNETAKRLQGRIEAILDYASALEHCSSSHPARWRNHLDKILPKPANINKVRHQPSMPYKELPAFFDAIASQKSISAQALKFLILTGTRSKETLNATWDEIDLHQQTWTIPAKKMKMRKKHRVPLSRQAINLINSLTHQKDCPYLFPSPLSETFKPLSGMALLQLMRKKGHSRKGPKRHCVPHGFRSSFRSFAADLTDYAWDVAEMALAHVISNKSSAAYQRGDLFEKRRKLMQEWGDYCEQPQLSLIDDPLNDSR